MDWGFLFYEIKAVFQYYNDGRYTFFLVFLLAAAFIGIFERERAKRRFFLVYNLLMLLIIWNPVILFVLNKMINFGSIYRVYYMLPNTITIAYGGLLLIRRIGEWFPGRKNLLQVSALVFFCGAIVFFGSSTYRTVSLQKYRNLYRLPEDTVAVAFALRSDDSGLPKKAVIPYGMSSQLRQVEPSVTVLYTRKVSGRYTDQGRPYPADTDALTEEDVIYKLYTGDARYVSDICNQYGMYFYVAPKDLVFDRPLEDFGFVRTQEAAGYVIYRRTQDPKDALYPRIEAQTVDLAIPGLGRDYRIAWISDTHIMEDAGPGEISPDSWEDYRARFESGSLRDKESGVTGKVMLDHIIGAINRDQVDALILGGDILDYCSSANIRTLEEALDTIDLPRDRILYVRSDHDLGCDLYPSLFHSVNPEALHASILDMGLSSEKIDLGDFVITGFDRSHMDISEEQANRIRSDLQGDRPVILATHVPFASVADDSLRELSERTRGKEYYWMGAWESRSSEMDRFLEELYSPDQAGPSLVAAGHLHAKEGWDGQMRDGVREHIFGPAYEGYYGIIQVHAAEP